MYKLREKFTYVRMQLQQFQSHVQLRALTIRHGNGNWLVLDNVTMTFSLHAIPCKLGVLNTLISSDHIATVACGIPNNINDYQQLSTICAYQTVWSCNHEMQKEIVMFAPRPIQLVWASPTALLNKVFWLLQPKKCRNTKLKHTS